MTSYRPRKVLMIGSGPIVIGQAAEFDYAGTQACKAMSDEGVEVVLVNSNPATVMTDEGIADHVYIEPMTLEVLERIIRRERPDGLLGMFGGQTALNLTVELSKAGILERFGVRVLGTSIPSIEKAEDRDKFRSLMNTLRQPVPPSKAVENLDDALEAARSIGYPVVVRPSYTLGGTGGGVVYNEEELRIVAMSGLASSRVHQVLVEKSLTGWKEIEYEVIRDSKGNTITVCNMENIDPVGVHTGDSIVVAPTQTLADTDWQRLRTASLNIIHGLEIEGACNIQFAYRPSSQVMDLPDDTPMHYVIEVNPRVSRSSALASKATGYPIARVAAKIAIGLTLDEITNSVTGKTTAAFEPALDYCVVKIPCWPFGKFPDADRSLGTQMKATGEVMAVDRTFEAALQKAIRSSESGRGSLSSDLHLSDGQTLNIAHPDDERLWKIAAELRAGVDPLDISKRTFIDPWFIHAIARITSMHRRLIDETLGPSLMRDAKRMGFSDHQIATLSDHLTEEVRRLRKEWDIVPVYKMVDTCAGEFEAKTPYFYSSYEKENEALPLEGDKAIVLGSGPIRIGQGIEFDYCSVHTSWALQKNGVKSIIINSNPETLSTDFDTSDRLYFEPLDEESVRDIVENETSSDDKITPVAVQFGGQTAINLSRSLSDAGIPILGSSSDTIDKASDRGKFGNIAAFHGLPQPPGGAASTLKQALDIADHIGYPVLIRPSYVLGGRAMEIVQSPSEMCIFFEKASGAARNGMVLIDSYLNGLEVEVDAVSDGEDVLIPGVMMHIERAGVHSGDSLAVYPGISLTDEEVDTIVDYTIRLGRSLNIKGLMNIQFVITRGATRSPFHVRPDANTNSKVYILEMNPRSSRTMPFISKVTGVPLINIAIGVMQGNSIKRQGFEPGLVKRNYIVAVKAPVFSMSKLTGADTFLGPEMKSTGEVMGIDVNFEAAITKALLASNLYIPAGVPVMLSVADRDKPDIAPLLNLFHQNGHSLYATTGTAYAIRSYGVAVKEVERISSGKSPNAIDIIREGKVGAVVNTVTGQRKILQDGFYIRRMATERMIPCFTSIDTALSAAAAEKSAASYNVRRMSEYLLNETHHLSE